MRKDTNLSVGLNATPEQKAICHKLGSQKSKADSLAAAEAIAMVTQQPLLDVIQQAPVFSNTYKLQTFGPDEAPTMDLSPLFDTRDPGAYLITSQPMPGGLATSQLQGANELVVQVHPMNGQASFDKKYVRAQNPRINIITDALQRLAGEVLLQQNLAATTVLMQALANSFVDGNPANTAVGNYQIVRTATAGVFTIDDFNTIMTKYRRIVPSWVGGTPVGARPNITDLFGSPEWMGQVRSIAYQPVNTRAGSIGGTETSNTSIAATDEVRNRIFNSGGLPNLFDVDLHEFNELGVGQIYNNLFATYATGTYIGNGGSGSATFNSATEQAIVALNLAWFDLVRLRRTDEGGAQWSLVADDQFPLRADKVGWFGQLNEGYVSVDNRGHMTMVM